MSWSRQNNASQTWMKHHTFRCASPSLHISLLVHSCTFWTHKHSTMANKALSECVKLQKQQKLKKAKLCEAVDTYCNELQKRCPCMQGSSHHCWRVAFPSSGRQLSIGLKGNAVLWNLMKTAKTHSCQRKCAQKLYSWTCRMWFPHDTGTDWRTHESNSTEYGRGRSHPSCHWVTKLASVKWSGVCMQKKTPKTQKMH